MIDGGNDRKGLKPMLHDAMELASGWIMMLGQVEAAPEAEQGSGIMLWIVTAVAVFLLIDIAIILAVLPPWLNARQAGLNAGVGDLLKMRLTGVNVQRVIQSAIRLRQAGVTEATVPRMAELYRDGADIDRLARGYAKVREVGLKLRFEEAVAAELAGDDLPAAVDRARSEGVRLRDLLLRGDLKQPDDAKADPDRDPAPAG